MSNRIKDFILTHSPLTYIIEWLHMHTRKTKSPHGNNDVSKWISFDPVHMNAITNDKINSRHEKHQMNIFKDLNETSTVTFSIIILGRPTSLKKILK